MKNEIINFCKEIGFNFDLVQASGGNISWKRRDSLWVKASGKKICDANKNNFFVEIDIKKFKDQLIKKEFDDESISLPSSKLRPSIETFLHLIIKKKFVLHIHALEILAFLVRDNCAREFKKIINCKKSWMYIRYFKPGAKLASALMNDTSFSRDLEVLFMQNHGVVVAADSIPELHNKLIEVLTLFGPKIYYKAILHDYPLSLIEVNLPRNSIESFDEFLLINNKNKSFFEMLFSRIESSWVLYPDHAVFLGEKPIIFKSITRMIKGLRLKKNIDNPFIFVESSGIYVNKSANQYHIDHLFMYINILIRQHPRQKLNTLTTLDVSELLDWDSEIYRKNFID
jgi:rhamnose utilization protein RhaD (predicted bifunctional aldolase and dehydrogenase)